MQIDDKTYRILFDAAVEEPERDRFVSEWATSSIWGNDEANLAELAEYAGKIWDTAHLTVKDIRAASGLSQQAFADRFGIPRRTIENWESGVNNPPRYVVTMLARLNDMV